jgi:hypothetical protein
VASLSQKSYSFNLHQGSSKHRCPGTPPASTKAGKGLGSAAMDGEKWLQGLLVLGTCALSSFPTLKLWEGLPNSQTHHHPLPQFFGSQACSQRRLRAPTRLQTTFYDSYRPSEGHQMGHGKRDTWSVPEGQGLPLPSRTFFPSQQLSWVTIWVQQYTATFVNNIWTSRRRKVFIRLRVFLSYM